jgi:hypothetical protein
VQSLKQFLQRSDLAMHCRQVSVNGDDPFLISEPWAPRQYSCELHRSNGDRPVKVIMGSDNRAPDFADVLDTVAAEAAVVDQAEGYEQWALHMGFDPDSRHGERVYRAARRQAKLLRQLLGDEQYVNLLWLTERL